MLSHHSDHSAESFRGITISDLHLLAERRPLSFWDSHKRIWREQFDLCVLNGDIFDFNWARLNHSGQSLATAQRWLESLLEPASRAKFVVLMGNHDATPAYREVLDALDQRYDHFTWREHWFLLGSKVFCHGDMPDLSGELQRLRAYRHHHSSRRLPRPIAYQAYATATRFGLTGAVPRILPWKRQCARTDALLRVELGTRYQEHVTDVYVGHTHVHFRNVPLNGKRFHNGGAPLPRGRFAPIAFDFDPKELERDWEFV